ncbi:MAG: T9SS type A sorting domain-containing protein [Saprospiraceae bacterium]|nr:T9SS type A sorting domain-containing protein [Saprospiraceae bacterium]
MIALPGISKSQDTLVCDNGGFENGFLYYFGFRASFYNDGTGSSSCTPLRNGNPVTFSIWSMPALHRFEIVNGGVDPVVNVSRTVFGSKSLLLNSFCSHNGDCSHFGEINRIKKRFLVTEENRDFTVWYSAVLENPNEHIDQQPFFSIRCDLAVSDDLCFDGISFQAKEKPRDLISGCNPFDSLCYGESDTLKYTDWACHRILIPKDKVGEIATLEITAADCAPGQHFGYVYIDGICEECDNSSYGSGTLDKKPYIIVSCDGDSITIKGRYTTPTIEGYTILDSILVPGFNIYGMNIDTISKTFSFRIVKSDFQSPNATCRDVIAYLKFKNNSGNFLPDVPTNAVEICENDFGIPEVDIIIGDCNRNHPTNNVFSDDYYYVSFTISNADNRHWRLERAMDDPYPDESGRYFLKTDGYGNGTYNLGPFLIQEGSWVLTLFYGGCPDTFQIIPPDYCSGCSALSKVKISNIQCDSATGTWSYDIFVPGPVPPVGDCWLIGQDEYQFNYTYSISGGQVSNQDCISLSIGYVPYCPGNPICGGQFDICPPKPCNNGNYKNCDLEAYFDGLHCIDNGNGNYSYTVEFNVSDAPYPCYKSFLPGNLNLVEGPFSNPLGPFFEPERIFMIYSCGEVIPYTCECPNTGCYKVFKIRKPEDCLTREEFGGNTSKSQSKFLKEVEVYPNPVTSDEWIIGSSMEKTEFEIFNASGKRILSENFIGPEHVIKCSIPAGLYLLRYKNALGEVAVLKFIKP